MSKALLLAALLLLCYWSLVSCRLTGPGKEEVRHGISKDLADHRSKRIRNPRYGLFFDLRGIAEGRVEGRVVLSFLLEGGGDLVLDFGGEILGVPTLNGKPLPPGALLRESDHLRIREGSGLVIGRNEFRCRFAARAEETGTPLIRFDDRKTGESFAYTLLVPADAHFLFPCFDQPDLRGIFELELRMPGSWKAVSNGIDLEPREVGDGSVLYRFVETRPLPTYLFAFAAGPFAVVDCEGPSRRGSRIFLRPSAQSRLDPEEMGRLHLRSIDWMESFFGRPYPFDKLDIVLCPAFPYSGMEHAGAIFYRERAIAFDHDPDTLELFRRNILVYHEVAHQWFGNLVTMRWFDDLWLKEGFATFASYAAMEGLEKGGGEAWLRFQQRVEPAAYRVDRTEGTRPIWQALRNLDEAKSNYGPIVYNKAPAVLRALETWIGRKTLRKGLRSFLEEHAFGSASWRDLCESLARASGRDVLAWAEAWFLEAGLPRIRVEREGSRFYLLQEDPTGRGRTWPLRIDLLVKRHSGGTSRYAVELFRKRVPLPFVDGDDPVAWILPNSHDEAYVASKLDEDSRQALISDLPAMEDRMARSVALSILHDEMTEGEIRPSVFASLCERLLREEKDPQSFARMISWLGAIGRRWTRGSEARALRSRIASSLETLLFRKDRKGLKLIAFRALCRLAEDPETLALLEKVCRSKVSIPGLVPGTQDRFTALAALLAARHPGARSLLERMRREEGQDVVRAAWLASCAIPDPSIKKERFREFLDPKGPPEQWVQAALLFFHWPGQEDLTLPFLKKALASSPWVKRNRKIFFLPGWLESFVGAHSSPEALKIVEGFARKDSGLPEDIRRKLAVPLFELRQVVRVRNEASRD